MRVARGNDRDYRPGMTPQLCRTITLRLATRAALERNDLREMQRLNALGDQAYLGLSPIEAMSYIGWAGLPQKEAESAFAHALACTTEAN